MWRRDGATWSARDHVGDGTFASPALEDEVEIGRLYRNTGLQAGLASAECEQPGDAA